MTDTATKINIFIAYAREDAAYLKRVRKVKFIAFFLIVSLLFSCIKIKNNDELTDKSMKNELIGYIDTVHKKEDKYFFHISSPHFHVSNPTSEEQIKEVEIGQEILFLQENHGYSTYKLQTIKEDSLIIGYKIRASMGFFGFRAKGTFAIGLTN